MFDPWTLLFFLPLFAQAYCLQYASSSTIANVARKLLWPVVILLSQRFTYNSFDPPAKYFPWNIAFWGVVPCFGVARGLLFATCDPEKYYTWTAQNPPKSSTGWATEVLLSMRGISWSYGSKAPIPPPLAKDTPTFIKRMLKRMIICHFGMTACAFPIVHLYKQGIHLDQLLLSTVGLEGNKVTERIVSTGMAMLFGLVAPCTMEVAYCITALLFCLFHCFFYDIGLAHKFDPTKWPPLFRNPAASESIRDFWSYKWHCLFLLDFLFLAFKPARSFAANLGFGKSMSYFAGVVSVFLLSGVGHEIALFCVSHQGVDSQFQTFVAFAVQPLGMLAEQLWTKSTGKRVGGWLGCLWAIGFIAFAFSFMVDIWLERGLVDGVPLYTEYKWYRFFIPLAPLLPEWFCTTIA